MKYASVLLLLSFNWLQAQELRRSGYFGFVPVQVDEKVAAYLGLKNTHGAFVQRVLPNSTASSIGLSPKDVILRVNNEIIVDHRKLYELSRNLHAGEKITMLINREGKETVVDGVIKERPVYTPEGTEIELGALGFNGGALRYSIQRPEGNGPFPLIYYIQGYTCGSVIDVPEYHPYARTANEFVKQGYAVLKVEKPGVGDSETEQQCEKIDFDMEVASFKAGLKAINNHPFIDTSRVTLFGHSLGGLIAPLIAEDDQIQSIVFYGVSYQPWQDYVVDRIRYQLPLFGSDYEEIDAKMNTIKMAYHEFFQEKRSPKEILKESPEYEEAFRVGLQYNGGELMFGRHYSFWQNLNDTVFPTAWKSFKGRTLGIYGTSDIAVLNGKEVERAIDMINHYNPGSATYWEVEEANHHLLNISMEENVKVQMTPQYTAYLQNRYDEELVDHIDEWIRAGKK